MAKATGGENECNGEMAAQHQRKAKRLAKYRLAISWRRSRHGGQPSIAINGVAAMAQC